MELTTPINLNLVEKFKNKNYFHKFFLARAKDEIAERIRKLREFRTLKQSDLAKLTGMKQSAISRIEQADYAGWNFKTLARVAEALDARLIIAFQTREEVIKDFERRRRAETRPKISVLDRVQQKPSLQKEEERVINEINRDRPGPVNLAFGHGEAERPTAIGRSYR